MTNTLHHHTPDPSSRPLAAPPHLSPLCPLGSMAWPPSAAASNTRSTARITHHTPPLPPCPRKSLAPALPPPPQIDGLAPVRSSKQDQIHNSIVSTLLALMDGLDSRGRVVVIGATNRPDALDGALRRPGRFDRELLFPLPNRCALVCWPGG